MLIQSLLIFIKMANSLLLSIPPSLLLPSNGRFNVRTLSVRATSFFPIPNPLKNPPSSSRTLKSFYRFPIAGGTSIGQAETEDGVVSGESSVGEDSAKFELGEQKVLSWVYFAGILGAVLFALDVLWIDPSTGYGTAFVNAVSGISESKELTGLLEVYEHNWRGRLVIPSVEQPLKLKVEMDDWKNKKQRVEFSKLTSVSSKEKSYTSCNPDELSFASRNRSIFPSSAKVAMLILIFIFAIVHSGLASLRDAGEKLIGERAFRVLFAGISLPLAVSTVVYFINHRYDGAQLWQAQSVPGVHELVWISNFISFFFLYPSTFNLLEVAAVDKPKMHLWETGIMRITRHPQMVGQVIWCLAHTLWIGNSVAAAASVGLIGHHLFGVWNGDRRLKIRYGEAYDALKSRTSVVPFAAIFDGRQKLPKDYYKEFIRLPYLTITALTLGAYFAHPIMQSSSFNLHW